MIDGHDIFQGIFQPLVGIYLVLFADGKKGIDHGCPLRRFMASGEEVIFAAKGNPTKRIFVILP